MRSDETTNSLFETSCCNNALSGTECTSLFLVLFQVGGDNLHSQCPLGRRHCQCLLLQGLPEEWLAPLLMTGVLKPGFPNASAPALHKLTFQSETNLMIPDRYNCPWKTQCFLFLSDGTDDFFGGAFRQGCLFSSLLFLKAFKSVC